MTEHNTSGPRSKPDEFPQSSPARPPDAAATASRTDCEYAARVSAYHDGEMAEDEAREVKQHIAGCAACAAELAFFATVSSTFETVPAPRLDAGAKRRLEELGDQFDYEPQRLRARPSADVRWVRRLTAAAAVLFIVAVGKVIYEQQFASHDVPHATPAVNPHDPVAPAPQPVSEQRPGGSHSPTDGQVPPVTNANLVVGQTAAKPPATGQSEKP